MIPVLCSDLDSTIANTYHRQHMIKRGPGQKTDWEAYSMACALDTPIEGTVELLKMLRREYPVFIVTGRSSAARGLTVSWLVQHSVPYDGLLMRPAHDRTKNGEYKVNKILQLRKEGYDPVLFLEDYPDAAEEIRMKTGVPYLLVNANYPASAPHQNVGGV